MIQDFKSYLLSQKVVAKKTFYFVRWVSQFYQYYKKEPGTSVTQQEINDFLSQLGDMQDAHKYINNLLKFIVGCSFAKPNRHNNRVDRKMYGSQSEG